jgi:hypothetical protein
MNEANASGFPHDQIAALAYELWQTEGYPAERALDHWCTAERILRVETLTPSRTSRSRRSKPAPVRTRRRATRRSHHVSLSL